MQQVTFKCDNLGKLYCLINNRKFDESASIELLNEIDKILFKNVSIDDKNDILNFSNNEESIRIENFDKFLKNNYTQYLSKLLSSVAQTYTASNKEKHKGENVVKHTGTKEAVVGSVSLLPKSKFFNKIYQTTIPLFLISTALNGNIKDADLLNKQIDIKSEDLSESKSSQDIVNIDLGNGVVADLAFDKEDVITPTVITPSDEYNFENEVGIEPDIVTPIDVTPTNECQMNNIENKSDDIKESIKSGLSESLYSNEDLLNEIKMNEEAAVEITPVEEEIVTNVNYDSTPSVLEFESDRKADTIKADHVNQFSNDIDKVAARWGISPIIVKSVLAQESGGYNSNMMQVIFSSWKDFPVTQYNYETGVKQTIVLTDNPAKYSGKNYTCISRSDLTNQYTNLSVGTFFLTYSIHKMNNNIPAGIQAYNYGIGAMDGVISRYSRATGLSKDQILADSTNIGYLNPKYMREASYGDQKYVSHVLSYAEIFDEDNIPLYIDTYNAENNSIDRTSIVVEQIEKGRSK